MSERSPDQQAGVVSPFVLPGESKEGYEKWRESYGLSLDRKSADELRRFLESRQGDKEEYDGQYGEGNGFSRHAQYECDVIEEVLKRKS
ncbi:MAG: hypothetical protein V1716_00765 [Candidatus Uhrbacteria bacterium]